MWSGGKPRVRYLEEQELLAVEPLRLLVVPSLCSGRYSPGPSVFSRAFGVLQGLRCSPGPSVFSRAFGVLLGLRCSPGPSVFSWAFGVLQGQKLHY